jgi:hypothetical protein
METHVVLDLRGPLHTDTFDITVTNSMIDESVVYTFDHFHYSSRLWEGLVHDYEPLLPGQERNHCYRLQLTCRGENERLLQRSRTLHFQFGVSYCVLDATHDDRDTPVDVHMHPDETLFYLGRISVPRHVPCDFMLQHTIQ